MYILCILHTYIIIYIYDSTHLNLINQLIISDLLEVCMSDKQRGFRDLSLPITLRSNRNVHLAPPCVFGNSAPSTPARVWGLQGNLFSHLLNLLSHLLNILSHLLNLLRCTTWNTGMWYVICLWRTKLSEKCSQLRWIAFDEFCWIDL